MEQDGSRLMGAGWSLLAGHNVRLALGAIPPTLPEAIRKVLPGTRLNRVFCFCFRVWAAGTVVICIAVLNIRRDRRKKRAGSSDDGSHSDSSDSDPNNGAGGAQLPEQHPAAPPPPPSGPPSGPPPTSNGRPRMQLQLSDSICKLTGVTRVVHVPVAKVQEGRGIFSFGT